MTQDSKTASAAAAAGIGRKTNIFDFLRLLAASAVVIGHSNAEFNTNFAWDTDALWDNRA